MSSSFPHTIHCCVRSISAVLFALCLISIRTYFMTYCWPSVKLILLFTSTVIYSSRSRRLLFISIIKISFIALKTQMCNCTIMFVIVVESSPMPNEQHSLHCVSILLYHQLIRVTWGRRDGKIVRDRVNRCLQEYSAF